MTMTKPEPKTWLDRLELDLEEKVRLIENLQAVTSSQRERQALEQDMQMLLGDLIEQQLLDDGE